MAARDPRPQGWCDKRAGALVIHLPCRTHPLAVAAMASRRGPGTLVMDPREIRSLRP